MFKNANILYEIKNSKRRHYYAKFQDLALKRRREIFYEMDPSCLKIVELFLCPDIATYIFFVYFIFLIKFAVKSFGK